jgi:hypothetical protein
MDSQYLVGECASWKGPSCTLSVRLYLAIAVRGYPGTPLTHCNNNAILDRAQAELFGCGVECGFENSRKYDYDELEGGRSHRDVPTTSGNGLILHS